MKKSKSEPLFHLDLLVEQLKSSFETSGRHMCSRLEPHQVFLFEKQVNAFTKKYLPDCFDTEMLDLEAYCRFIDNNSTLPDCIFPTNPVGIAKNRVQQVLYLARQRIKYVLGEFVEDTFLRYCSHSAGASRGVSFFDTSPEAKMRGLTFTEGVDRFFDYYLTFDGEMSKYCTKESVQYKQVNGSRATTVPKDATKSRMICIEPTLNMFFQQGLMHFMTSRLKTAGINLGDQQEKNQYCAWNSSLTGTYSTIDFSDASDRISYDLVRYLIPSTWFSYLDRFRSPIMEIEGSQVYLNCFSTMGNACTFPLETLIFWAIAESCVSSILDSTPACNVFGDDVIIPETHASLFLQVSAYVGFRPNLDKSYLSGRFFESCGGDFLAGKDVRPYSLTRPDQLTCQEDYDAFLYILVNRLISIGIRLYGPLLYIYVLHNTFKILLDKFIGRNVLVVPTDYPDDSGMKFGFDLARFRRWFSIRTNLRCDRNGVWSFSFLTFKYFDRKSVDFHLRYCIAMKKRSSQTPHKYRIKRRGKYVCYKDGRTPFFSVS